MENRDVGDVESKLEMPLHEDYNRARRRMKLNRIGVVPEKMTEQTITTTKADDVNEKAIETQVVFETRREIARNAN